MYSKTPRLRSGESGSSTAESVTKSPTGAARSRSFQTKLDEKCSLMTTQESRNEEDSQSGSFSVKRVTSMESEQQSHTINRPNSTDRKAGTADSKKLCQRELKRTNSFIPRATPQKPKVPISSESKRVGRKSDTSLKNKDPLYEESRDRRSESVKTSRSTLPSLSDGGRGPEMNETRKRPETSKTTITVRGSHRDGSLTRGPGKGRLSMDKLQRRNSSVTSTVSQFQPKSLEAQYAAKKSVYILMVKEFKEKEKAIREHFKSMTELRKKIFTQTGKEIQPEDNVTVGDTGPPFVLSEDAVRKYIDTEQRAIITFETKVFNDIEIDFSDFQNTFESAITESREVWVHLIPSILNSRQDVIAKIKELHPDFDTTTYEKEDENIEISIESAKYFSKLKAEELLAELGKLYMNREYLKQQLQILLDNEKFQNLIAKDYKDMTARLREVEEELKKEKVRTEDLMEKREVLEHRNSEADKKIANLEKTIGDLQVQLLQVTTQYKTLRQKDLLTTARGSSSIKTKDMKDMKDLKAKSELLKALENHITELTADYNAQKKNFQMRITDLEKSLGEKEEALKSQTESASKLETSLAEAEEKLKNVREKQKAMDEMVDKTKQILQTSSSGSTRREEQLWTELEATKVILKGYQDQVTKLTEEKNKILLKFQTISEDKANPNSERIAADLVRKDEIIKNLKEQVTQLQAESEKHSLKYNKLLAQIKEAHEKIDGKPDATALSKQLGEMKIQKKNLEETVKELVSHNEELETALVQRCLELDQRDRLVKQQCNLLKMRDELTDLVRNKDHDQYQGVKKAMEQSTKCEGKTEKIYKDLEKKANGLDDMYKVLVEKQRQVEKLTKLVKMMEDQQERAQEQRVRFENKITELQKQISDGKQKAVKPSLLVH